MSETTAESPKIMDFVKTQVEALAQLRLISNVLSIALAGTVLLFVALFYTALTGNFTADKLQKAAERYGPDAVSPVADALIDIAYGIAPTYEAEISKAAVAALPRMTQVAEREILKLSEQIGELAQKQLDSSFRKVLKAPDSALHKKAPSINLTSVEVDNIIQDNLKQSEHFLSTRMMAEVDELRKTMFAFEDKSLPSNELELSKLFIHNMLMVADQEMMTVK